MKNKGRSISDVVGEALGLDPTVKYRASMLPLVRTADDKVELGVPSMLADLLGAFMLPGHVAQGGSYTPEDVTNMAMNVGMMGAPVGYATAPKGALGMGGSKRIFDLPMDEASRMNRANDMGFHTDLYHGTGSDITEFVPQRRGVYLTDRPEIANIYAEGSSKNNSIRAQTANAGPNIMPLKLRGKVLEISDLGPDGTHGWSSDNLASALGINLEDFPVGSRARDMDALAHTMGYSAIKTKDMMDLGGIQSQWRVLDPTAVRSRFAKFDPSMQNSTKILSMNPATAAIPQLFTYTNQQNQ